ncbi:MAG: RagB/SusD family nutrient uptake outer membrane protein [Prevotella sp.]|nr:RagB/SusD family nutrient uptake outer membrane protein [Prevotella sp.]
MKMKAYIKLTLVAALTAAMASCDSYLDKLPDDRAELTSDPELSAEKIGNLLVSAYPLNTGNLILEISSDNVTDNGERYSTAVDIEQLYRFKDVTDEGNDDPRSFWNGCYTAVATANQALEAIDESGNPESMRSIRAEALLCRAFGMFQLANVFCMAYDPTKADEYLGLPYPTEPEKDVNTEYERGTLAELYANIDADIEAALPDITDDRYVTPKYHFNVKAAYAFAARFNLYYHRYDKVIQYASEVLGLNPTDYLRNREPYANLGYNDYYNRYIQSTEACNFLLLPAYSIVGRTFLGQWTRYNHGIDIVGYETYWALAPWATNPGTSSNNLLWASHRLYGTNQVVFEPKMLETFEYTDKVNRTGYPHIVDTYFTGDETLLCRAEAYALRNQGDDLQKAVDDINYWAQGNLEPSYGSYTRPTYTIANLTNFISALPYAPVTVGADEPEKRSIKKVLHPQGFTVAEGQQESIVHTILQARRVTTTFQGLRFLDLKRYGIEYGHYLDGEEAVVFTAGDLRGAIQLPNDVISAGLEANPR